MSSIYVYSAAERQIQRRKKRNLAKTITDAFGSPEARQCQMRNEDGRLDSTDWEMRTAGW